MTYTVKVAGDPVAKTFSDLDALATFLRALDVVTEVTVKIRISLPPEEQQ